MTLKHVFQRFKIKISLTLLLVILEAVLMLLFPLYIGEAIQTAIDGTNEGLYKLGILSGLVLIMGGARRYYDSRVYANIYSELATELSSRRAEHSTSKISANVNLLREIVLFFESSLPQLFGNFISLAGTLVIVFTLNKTVFLACLVVFILTFVIYGLTSNKTILFNKNYNNELEEQVHVLNNGNVEGRGSHFKRLMKWSVKLSDIETFNFSGVWGIMSGLLIFSILMVVKGDELLYGAIFAIIMYVFQFMESAMTLPYYYQQTLRLKDISNRLNELVIN